jgi:glycosyltransferase involved in cell wall biosynthesis
MTSKQAPLVSVVTPVYNGESHLRQCIESILAQTYTRWEHVIVNNCSTDGTLEIALEYAAKDPRLRLHDGKTFVPVIENHNIAFRQISSASKYCKVVAADDWLFPDCLEKMVALAEEHPSVAIVQAYRLQETTIEGDGLPYPSTLVAGREVCRNWLVTGGPSIFGAPTTLLYRSDIVRSRHSFYNESNLHADTEVCLEFLQHYDYGFVHQVLTFQRLRKGSMTSYSQKFNTYLARRLYDLITYGPIYLSQEELARAVRKHLREYYRYLAWQLFKGRDREFWSMHSEKLAALGYGLSPLNIAWHALAYFVDTVLNPKRTVEKIVRWLRGDSGQEKA